jgi:hypothetical protein
VIRITFTKFQGMDFILRVIPSTERRGGPAVSTFSRPFRRVTSNPHVRLIAVTQLLELVCSFRCSAHNHPAAVHQVMNGRITYTSCCEDLLDRVERGIVGLRQRESA